MYLYIKSFFMKTFYKIFIFILSFFIANGAYWFNIEELVPVDTKTIEFTISPEVDFSEWEIIWEVKVLKDMWINYVSKDFEDPKKLILNLRDALKENRAYNLLSVFWVDGNIDFVLWDELNLIDIENKENIVWIQWISRILVVDSRTMEIYFNENIESTEFEFKLFRETLIENIFNDFWKLLINIGGELEKNSDYLFMIISMKDSTWDDIIFDEEIYDFSIWNDLKEPWEEEIIEEDLSDNLANEEIEKTMSGELDNVALNAAITPKSWPETWVLIFLTAIVNIVLIVRKKFK